MSRISMVSRRLIIAATMIATGSCAKGVENVSSGVDGASLKSHRIGGKVFGLSGKLVLQNNGVDNLAIFADGDFSFAERLTLGEAYRVVITTQPAGQTCIVTGGEGSIEDADIMSIVVNCPPTAPTLGVSAGVKQLEFSWTAVSGAVYYKLSENPDGASGYTQVGGNLTATSTAVDIAVHRHNWANASYMLDACNSGGCTPSAPVSTLSVMLRSIGYVKASNAAQGDNFGLAVALSGDGKTLAVGTYVEDGAATFVEGDQTSNSAPDSGAVYVYTRSGTAWIQTYVKASNTHAGDHFGETLALSDDGKTLAVGAPLEDSGAGADGKQLSDCEAASPVNCAASSGAVYIYTSNGTTWTHRAYIKAANAEANDHFGEGLALSGDGNTLAVGADLEDSALPGINGNPTNNAASNSGAVYIYARNDSTWAQQAYVKASNAETDDYFGAALALSDDGNTLAVGAFGEDSAATGVRGNPVDDCEAANRANCAANSGAVYIYTRSGTTWTEQSYVKATNTDADDWFGLPVALSGDGNILAVGATGESGAIRGIDGDQTSNAAASSGAAYIYARVGGVWTRSAYVKATNTEADDLFGFAIALSGDGNTLVVGAHVEDGTATGINGDQEGNAFSFAGAAYVYTRGGATWKSHAYVKAPNADPEDSFGIAVALSGDGNTLAVGAFKEDSVATGVGGDQTNDAALDSGAVYLY